MKNSTREQLRNYSAYLFDLDGTVYLGGKLIEGAEEVLEKLRAAGKSVCFVTNNSSLSGADYTAKLNRLGLKADRDEVFTSSIATISYLKANHSGQSVYLLATPSVVQEFAENGISLVEDDPDICVLAYDQTLTFEKIKKFNYFLAKGAKYIATHPDDVCPAPEVFMPDLGAFMAMFKVSSGRNADIIIGKPYPYLAEAVKRAKGIELSDMAMFGDRLHTDIAFANNAGMTSVLVFSGETTPQMLSDRAVKPDFTLSSIAELLKDF